MNWIRWAPWRRYKDAVEADGDLPEGVPAEEIIEAKNNRGTVIIETRERAPREFYISKKDAEKYKIYTRGCGGCTSWTRGLARQPHTPECRERFRKAMAENAKVTSAQERKREFEDHEIEKRRKKDEKKERKKREREETEEDREAEVEGRLRSDGDGQMEEDDRVGTTATEWVPRPPSGSHGHSVSTTATRVEPQDEEMGDINLVEIEDLIGEWVAEIQQVQADEYEEETSMEQAWDDVKGGELPIEKSEGSQEGGGNFHGE